MEVLWSSWLQAGGVGFMVAPLEILGAILLLCWVVWVISAMVGR